MTGSDDGDGTSAHPFATLSRAQTAVRARPVSDRHVLIGDGTYHLAATLALNSKDDGSVYEAINAGRVVLSAGRPLPADAERVTEAAILAQLPPASRAATEASAGSGAGGDGSDDDVRSVRVVDLKASFGLTDYPSRDARSHDCCIWFGALLVSIVDVAGADTVAGIFERDDPCIVRRIPP